MDADAGRHVRPFRDIDPATPTFEVIVHEQLFKSVPTGVSHLRLSGQTFGHAANGFPRIGDGAIDAHGGHHRIIEDCTIRDCNSVGIEVGARTVERPNADDAERPRESRINRVASSFAITTCSGVARGGIRGHTVRDAVLECNHLHDIG